MRVKFSTLTTTAILGAIISLSGGDIQASANSLHETSNTVRVGDIIDGVTVTEVIDLEHREREDGLIDLVDPTSGNVWFVLEENSNNAIQEEVKSIQKYSCTLGPKGRYTISGHYLVGVGSSFSMNGTASNSISLTPGMLNRLTGQYTNFGTWTKSFSITATLTNQTPGASNTFTMSPTILNNSTLSSSLSGTYNVIR